MGGANGIGRLDLVENRYVGMKSRGCYETPGGTILLSALIEQSSQLTLDREVAHLKDSLMPQLCGEWYTTATGGPQSVICCRQLMSLSLWLMVLFA